jgi:probable DNA repair protein
MEAWDLVHAWRLLPALQSIPLADETHAFLRWAQAYDAVCAHEQFIDQARLADLVCDLARAGAFTLPGHLLLFGFDRLDPQQDALLAALRSDGVRVDTQTSAGAPSPAAVLRHPGVTEEVRAAAQWARSRLAADPDTRIGVVVPELTRLRPTIARIFDEVLLPERLLYPGQSVARSWNISLGLPLAQRPLVHAALLMLELACGSVTIHGAGLLLRSPFLGGGESERIARSLLDARLRRLGDPHVTLEQLIYHAGVEGHAHTCGVLVDRLMALRYRVRELPAGAQPVSFWGPALQSLLSAVQWPGERELNSDEYQTFHKWKELMAGLAQLDLVSAPLTFEAAVHMLRRLAGEELFQPQTPDVPIQVLGLLESAQLDFDHLLVLGLTDEAWPRMPRANPLLPAALQRARGVPPRRSRRRVGLCQPLASGMAAGRPTCCSAITARTATVRSARARCWPGCPRRRSPNWALSSQPTGAASIRVEETEVIADWTGLALPEAAAFDGGARLLQDQAACRFVPSPPIGSALCRSVIRRKDSMRETVERCCTPRWLVCGPSFPASVVWSKAGTQHCLH